jgi:DNA-binding transcriptional ArsR family regulator
MTVGYLNVNFLKTNGHARWYLRLIALNLDKKILDVIVRYMSNNNNINVSRVEYLADIFKALSNANRLKIFLALTTCCRPGTVGLYNKDTDVDTMFIGDLGKELDIGKSTVSHHIKELRRIGIIKTERRGQKIACWVDPGIIAELKAFFSV